MNNVMTEEQYEEYRKRRNESARKYALNNLEKVKECNRKWRSNNLDSENIFQTKRY